MKKTLLILLALAGVASVSMADDYEFVFEGNDDVYGLVRQTEGFDSVELLPEIKIQEEGIDLTLTMTNEGGKGFALTNFGDNNSGILVYSSFKPSLQYTLPKLVLSVPNGEIKYVKIGLSGIALNQMDVNFNGVAVEESTFEGGVNYWTWTTPDKDSSVEIDWNNTYYSRYIHSIELNYTKDLKGKKECGLSFADRQAEAIIGESFKAPSLSNPNKLTVNWTSSNDQVATVDASGNLTLISGGTTVIKASTEGNAQFAPGNTQYKLRVIPSAANIKSLFDLAPAYYDKVYVKFPATVMFANLGYAFVIDAEGTAACFENIKNQNSTSTSVETIYSVGQVIPGGWIATNATINESAIWQGIPPRVSETVSVSYPEVKSVTKEDADRVVVLMNVKFETLTASGNTKAYGTTPDGTKYEFQDTYNAQVQPAGVYDVTAVVRYSKRGDTVYFYLAPISYKESDTTGVNLSEANSDIRYYNLHGMEVNTPKDGMYIKVADGKAVKVIVK